LGFNVGARDELIRTYNEKELDLNERLERERGANKTLRNELKSYLFI